ncbi:MAG: hypothetical protein K6G88_07725 [Lachnospiraceae bacterium]|nr:hypothetical protein [Lachnospiraceae bacterium]
MKGICKSFTLLILFAIDILKFGLAVVAFLLKTILIATTVITSLLLSFARV